MSIKDGGPAYPVTEFNNDSGEREVCGGMSLRDHFAGLAMQGAMVNATGLGQIPKDERAKHLAEAADMFYEIADAMLRAREAGQ